MFRILEDKGCENPACVGLSLWVRSDNAKAIRFYRKFGFIDDPRGPVQRDEGVALIDALGFKGIWQRTPVPDVMQKLQRLRQEATADPGARWPARGNVLRGPRLVFLSDTVVIAVDTRTPDEMRNMAMAEWGKHGRLDPRDRSPRDLPIPYNPLGVMSYAVKACLAIASSVTTRSARSSPVLAYRGAIATDQLAIDDDGRFIVGPAIDEAARNQDSADGAFVWLTEGALKPLGATALQGPLTYERGRVVAFPYDVPMKAPHGFPQPVVRTLAVTPFGWCDSLAECDEVENALMASFAGGHGIATKQANTKAFLDEARKHWRPPQW